MCIAIQVARADNKCPVQKTVYKYIPRTFDDEQNAPVYVSDIFATMFSSPSTWTAGINQVDERKQEVVNKYFISQV